MNRDARKKAYAEKKPLFSLMVDWRPAGGNSIGIEGVASDDLAHKVEALIMEAIKGEDNHDK